MADKFTKSNLKYDSIHDKRLRQIEQRIKAIYKKATDEAALIGTALKRKGLKDKPFTFASYPVAKEQADKLIEQLRNDVEKLIVNGVEEEWTLANQKNDKLSSLYFGNNVDKLTPQQFKKYFSNNDSRAVVAFLGRQIKGLNLSDKVWKYSEGFKNEIEMAIDLGLRDGKSASALSRDLRGYLQQPNKLFRRVRDEHGVLHLSKAAKAYKPGQGVYRSSYMNAKRLAVTEINMAYRTADYQRQQQLDFIVGIRIVLSNNHNCKGVPAGMFHDICDELQGEYPKDFKFTGWHPHCRCHVETILKTPSEMKLDTERILKGRRTRQYSRNAIKETPPQFNEWIDKNRERIITAREHDNLPYFLRDNSGLYCSILGLKDNSVKGLSILERAIIRHNARTPESIKKIKEAWNARKAKYKAIETEGKKLHALLDGIKDVDTKTIKDALNRYDLDTVQKEIARLTKIQQEIKGLSLLDDPMAVAKEFSLAEAKAVQNAVKSKLETYSYRSLEQQLIDVRSEANWVANHKKYATSDVALAAYKKEANRLASEIKKQEILDKMVSVNEFLGKYPHQKKVKDLYKQIQEALQNNSYDDANGLISDANKLMAKEEMEAVKAAAKKSAKSVCDIEKYCDEHRTFDSMVNEKTFEAFQERRIVESGEPWLKASKDSKRSLSEYTSTTYDTINASYWRDHTGCSDGTLIDKILDNCFMTEDVVLRRGCDRSELKSIFGNVFGDAVFAEDYNLLNSLKGAKGVNEGFISTSFDMTGGFHKAVELRIFAPKGTQAFYAKPVSMYGDKYEASWDGKNAIKEFKSGLENEIIVHRGYEYRFLKAEPGDNSKIRIFIELLTRNKRIVK